MDLRTDVQSRRREQHIGMAVRLQSRWQEVSERERRAQLHNRKLLQDFQRAQDTLSDLVARTEAMNTIRVEYERYLEENYPRWQKKLKDKRLSEQRKRIEAHLKACAQQMEEDQRMDRSNKSPVRTNSPSSISPDLFHPPTSHPVPSDYKDKRREVHVQMPRSTLSQEDIKIHDHLQPSSIPFTWLTQSQPSVNRPQGTNIPKETIYQALNSSLSQPGNPHQGQHPVVQQEPPYNDHLRHYPKAWAGGVQWDPAGAPWSVLPFVNPLVWRMMGPSESTAEGMQSFEEVQGERLMKSYSNPQPGKHQAKKQRRKANGSDQFSKLDSKSAHQSSIYQDSSQSSALFCERRREKQTYKPTGDQERVSLRSSSTSDIQNNESDTCNLSSPARRTFRNHTESETKTKSTTMVVSPNNPEEVSEQESQRIQEPFLSSSSDTEKKKKRKKRGYYKKEDRVSEEVNGCLSGNSESEGRKQEERVGPGHRAQDEEEESEGNYESNGGGHREEDETDEEVEEKALVSNSPRRGSLSKKLVGYVGEREVDDGGEENKDEGREEEENGGEEEEEEVGEEKDKYIGEEEEEDGEEEETDEGTEEEGDSGEEEETDEGTEEEGDGGEEEVKDGREEEEEDSGEEEEAGEDEDKKKECEKEEEADDMSVEVRAPKRSKGGEDESDEEGSDSKVAASCSGASMHNSLKELYKDEETEDEELYDQEIEDDTENEDDDVVVEKAFPWSRDPAYNHTKYKNDDYDDDVEGLLAPQNCVQQHQTDKAEEIIKPKDLQSDSEEDSSHVKAPSAPVKDDLLDSDDEFDHFYD